jgi:2-iminobutanoate/2-iminopropanoate deaminase
MVKKVIPFDGLFPLSKAIIHNHQYTMEISGQIGFNFETDVMEEGIENQTHQVMRLIKKILEDEGWCMADVVKTRIYLADMSDYSKMNNIYASYFTKNFPTRFALAVKELPRMALVEIDCTATRESLLK